ncbi:hypothetical protein XAB3213_1650003 [Xanthomonas citri pv. bilvae]|nr:hypothetical protein XAB3213_1650003 [Xanthomonas citri pv. bilvae]
MKQCMPRRLERPTEMRGSRQAIAGLLQEPEGTRVTCHFRHRLQPTGRLLSGLTCSKSKRPGNAGASLGSGG